MYRNGNEFKGVMPNMKVFGQQFIVSGIYILMGNTCTMEICLMVYLQMIK
jgi:hypothetical protein